jgi:hypothetical protein
MRVERFSSSSRVRASQAAAHNKAMHSLNGNIFFTLFTFVISVAVIPSYAGSMALPILVTLINFAASGYMESSFLVIWPEDPNHAATFDTWVLMMSSFMTGRYFLDFFFWLLARAGHSQKFWVRILTDLTYYFLKFVMVSGGLYALITTMSWLIFLTSFVTLWNAFPFFFVIYPIQGLFFFVLTYALIDVYVFVVEGRIQATRTLELFHMYRAWFAEFIVNPTENLIFYASLPIYFYWMIKTFWTFCFMVGSYPGLMWGHICFDLPWIDIEEKSYIGYIKLRIFLSFLLFFLGFLPGLAIVAVVSLIVFILVSALGAYTMGLSVFVWFYLSFLQQMTVIAYCFLNKHVLGWVSRESKILFLQNWLLTRALLNRAVYFVKVHHPDAIDAISEVSVRSDVRAFDDYKLNQVFRRVFLNYHGLSQIASFISIFLVACILCFDLLHWTTRACYKVTKRLLWGLLLATAPWFMPAIFFDFFFGFFVYYIAKYHYEINFILSESNKFLKFINCSFLYGVHSLSEFGRSVEPSFRGGKGERFKIHSLWVRSFTSLSRRSVFRIIQFLDDASLPEFIQATYKPPTLESIRSTYVWMKDMGFPVDQTFIDSLDRPEVSDYLVSWGSWRNWLLGTSNFALGFRPRQVFLRSWLPDDFFPHIPGFIHSTTFTGVVEELKSTARYWTGSLKAEDDAFEEDVDNLFEAVKIQFGNSKLATFAEVYKNWNKRFNMGFGFGRFKNSRLYQMTRSAVIEFVGGRENFLGLWARVFKEGQNFVLPAPVFTKWESLKLKKALARAVRTIVGSQFVHHVRTTVFNYHPNHNYHVWETPSKVGMPINGQNFDRLWSSLLGRDFIWAGDMTAFDSTQAPYVLKVVAEMRKKGFTMHKDYHRICELIDISYDQLRDTPMGFKNFGDIAFKEQGFTTGHSSTSPDNTLALDVNYLFAWRHVTGLRAREFFNFNTLANFGDDHILGWDSVFGWNPTKAAEAMKELGTIMRDEAPGEHSLPRVGHLPKGVKDARDLQFAFLAKKPLPIDSAIDMELRNAGVTCKLNFATCHDKSKLLGKIKGQILRAATRPEPSYDALCSYLFLCAHHKDVYDSLAQQANALYMQNRNVWRKSGFKAAMKKPPSYNEVIRQWYSAEPFPYSIEQENTDGDVDFESGDDLYISSSPDEFGVFIRWLSDFPTILTPRFANLRWADWLQTKAAAQLSWPLSFIDSANLLGGSIDVARNLATKTPYSFLRSPNLHLQDVHFTTLLVRHLIFMSVTSFLIPRRRALSVFDLIRALDHFILNALFVSTGRIIEVLVDLDLHIMESLLVFLLSYLHVPNLRIPPLMYGFQAPSVLLGRALTYVIRYFNVNSSIDFQPFDARVRALNANPRYTFTLQAGTGVGKSTRCIHRIATLTNRLVIVIVPRQLVAISVGSYMQTLFPHTGVFICCEGYTVGDNPRIVYTTVQSFLSNPKLRHPENVFVLDEAHIMEPHYIVMRNYLLANLSRRQIWITATPIPNAGFPTEIRLSAVSPFVVDRFDREAADSIAYCDAVVEIVKGRSALDRHLIFVPGKKEIEYLYSKFSSRICVLKSGATVIDPTASVFVSTSVSDAGLTIPDCTFVYSLNYDVTVTKVSTGSGIKDRAYLFPLSQATIRQRMGRTGRTSDGVFTFFTVPSKLDELAFTTLDFIENLRPAVQVSIRYWPIKNQEAVPAEFEAFAVNFDRYAEVDWNNFDLFYEEVRQGVPLQRALREWTENFISSYKFMGSKSYAPEENPFDPYGTLHYGPKEAKQGPSEKYYTDAAWGTSVEPPPFNFDEDVPSAPVAPARKISKKAPLPDPRNEEIIHDWVDVSGANLLCGARALRGCIGVTLKFRPPITLLSNLLASAVKHRPDALQFQNFFAFEQIQSISIFYFGLSISCFGPDGDILCGNPKSIHKLHFSNAALMRLQKSHYNFWGHPQSSIDSSNAFVVSLWRVRIIELVQIHLDLGYTLHEPGVLYDFYGLDTQESRDAFFKDLPFLVEEPDDPDEDFDESLIFAFFATTLLSVPDLRPTFGDYESMGAYARALTLNSHLLSMRALTVTTAATLSPLQRFNCMSFWLQNLFVELEDLGETFNFMLQNPDNL